MERHLAVVGGGAAHGGADSVSAGVPALPVRTWVPATKLAPPAERDDLVLDPEVVDRLVARARSSRLTLVVAQGGAGKTTLAAALAPRLATTVAWVRLDESDDGPRAAAELIVLAVDAAVPGAAATALDLVTASHPIEARRLMGVLVNDLIADGREVALVLDDAHHLTDQEGLAALDHLIANAPPGLRVIAAARRAPKLRLARLRAGGELAEVGPDELRFDVARAEALLGQHLGLGLGLDRGRVAELVRVTGGWVTALVLSARADADPFGSPEGLEEYIDEELLAAEAEDVRELLLATSVLDVVSADSARALTGRDDAGAVLADVRRRLPLLVDVVDGCYRYHDLLRDHLREALRRDTAAWRRASARAAEASPPGPDRVDHLLAAGAQDRAAEEVAVLTWRRPVEPALVDRVLTWADRLEAGVRAEHPRVELAAVAALMYRGRSDLVVPRLESILVAAEEDFELRWLALRHLFHATSDRERLLPLMRAMEADPRFAGLPVVARVESGIGGAWGALWRGDADEARRRVEEVRSLVRRHVDRAGVEALAVHYTAPLTAWPDGAAHLADHARWALETFGGESASVRVGGRLQLASAELLTGTGSATVALTPGEAELAASVPYWAGTLVWLRAVRARVQGDLVATAAAVAGSAAALPSTNPMALTWRTALAPLAASALRQQGRPAAVEALHLDLRRLGETSERQLRERALGLVGAEAAWAAGQLDRAEGMFRAVVEAARGVEVVTMLEAEAELAVLLAECGRLDEAAHVLVPLLERVAPSGAFARLAASGVGLVPVLQHVEHRRKAATAVLALLEAPVPAPPAPRAVPGSPEVLTSREVEVLQELATGASNAEIGRRLFLSENTVKTHLKRVLAKLESPSRTAATARARELGLL